MRKRAGKGAITVFLSLVSVLFLSLLCTTVESARIQGCRAKAAAALDMGLFSVMGEFERELLEHYDVFFLDGAAGSGSYSTDQINSRLREFMEYNVNPKKGLLIGGFDPFRLNLEETKVTGVCLATDEQGQAFFQQAVSFMRENAGTEILSGWIQRMGEGKQLQEAGKNYEKQDAGAAKELKNLEQQQKEWEQKQEMLEKQAQEGAQSGEEGIPEPDKPEPPAVPERKNPLKIIKKIKKEGILGLVLPKGKERSQKKLAEDVPSKRRCQKGNLPVKKEHGGMAADLLFQEYLFERFALFTDEKKELPLDYALEYILCGNASDEKNLKSVVNRLLLLREGANFLYLMQSGGKKAAATAFAELLTGAVPIPGLSAATAYALLLVWAYGESLLDVRELLAGGKVPVFKGDDTWRLELEAIPDILELLENTSGDSREGLSYAGYLQILFTLGKKKAYPMRALDLIEGYMRGRTATGAFRADHAVCRISGEADYRIPPQFLSVSSVFLKTGQIRPAYHVRGSFSY